MGRKVQTAVVNFPTKRKSWGGKDNGNGHLLRWLEKIKKKNNPDYSGELVQILIFPVSRYILLLSAYWCCLLFKIKKLDC